MESRSTAAASRLQYHTAGEREAERLGRGLINHICFEARRKDCLQVCPSSPRAACSTWAPAHTPEGHDTFKRGGWAVAGFSQSPLPMLPARRFPVGWWCSLAFSAGHPRFIFGYSQWGYGGEGGGFGQYILIRTGGVRHKQH